MHFCHIYYCSKKKEEKPDEYVRKLLEYGFLRSFGMPYEEAQTAKTEYGKPCYLKAGVFYNISHGQQVVALACSDREVGADVESMRPVGENAIRRSCTKEELDWLGKSKCRIYDFLRLWTLKESYVKMTGEGFRIPPSQVGFRLDAPEEEIRCDKGGCFVQYRLEEGILSVCQREAFGKGTVKLEKIEP